MVSRLIKFFCLCSILAFLFISIGSINAEAKGKKKDKDSSTRSLEVLSNDGESVVYGSVLNPKLDEVNVLLTTKLFKKLRKLEVDDITVTLTSTVDSTKTYQVSSDSLRVQRKKLGNQKGAYLTANLFNLTTQSGIIISPSALPIGDYKLRLVGDDIDATTGEFNYQTPSLIVGTVDSDSPGLVTVEDLQGNTISERTVATNPDGAFFTEVRANKKTAATKARKYLKNQTVELEDASPVELEEAEDVGLIEVEPVELIDTGVVHVVADTDLYAVVPLVNDAENNSAITNKPIEVNDGSTIAAQLAIAGSKEGSDDLAFETAKEIVENLKSDGDDEDDEKVFNEGGKESFECDLGDIGQFSPRCSDNEEVLASIGKDFREFVSKANCIFPEFKLIKAILPKLPEGANVFIGRGYCEISQEKDENRPCEIYASILRDFKRGIISELPCPPRHCDEYESIKPPQCVEPTRICEEFEDDFDDDFDNDFDKCHSEDPDYNSFTGPNGECVTVPVDEPFDFEDDFNDDEFDDELFFRTEEERHCVHKPTEDLFCAKIGKDIDASKCKDDGFGGQFNPKWIIVKDSKGEEYCVPSNIPKPPPFPTGFEHPLPPTTPQDIVEECSTHECHRTCEREFRDTRFSGPKFAHDPSGRCLECDCHFECDAKAGRARDCGNPESKYFHVDCCNGIPFGPVVFESTKPGFFPKKPVFLDVRGCLCETKDSFDEKGFVKEEAINQCKENCPSGFEKDPHSLSCLPICPEGLYRDPSGICRKKCPEGFMQDEFGCRCPEGQIVGTSGKCEPLTCPAYCKNLPLVREFLEHHDFSGAGTYIPPGGTGSSTGTLPPECQKCFGGGDFTCPPGQIYVEEQVVCITTPCPPIKRCLCPDKTLPSPNGQCEKSNICTGNMFPNPNIGSNQAQCICPQGLPFWDSRQNLCVAICSDGRKPFENASGLSNSPIPCDNGNTSGKCFGEKPYLHNGICVVSCPVGTTPSVYNNFTSNTSTITNSSQLECLCSNGARPGIDGSCGSSTGNYCPSGIQVGTNGCTCNPAGGAYNSNGYCTCPSGTNGSYTKETGCSSNARPCTAGEGPSNGCYCFDGGFVGSDGKCQCTNGQSYTGGGCSSTSTNYCSPGIQVSTNSCTCNPAGGAYNSNGYCTCPSGSSGPYTKETGCTVTSRTCTPGEVPTASNPCICGPNASFGSGNTCQCPNGQAYTQAGCPAASCTSPKVSDTAFPSQCVCPSSTPLELGSQCVATCPEGLRSSTRQGGPTTSTIQVCECPNGNLPDNTGSCGFRGTVSLTSAVINGNNLAVTFTADYPNDGSCTYLQDANGVTLYSLFCGSTTGTTVSAPISTFPHSVSVGDQVRLVKSNDNTVISSSVPITVPSCTSPKVLNSTTNTCVCPAGQTEDSNGQCITPQTLTLSSAQISGSDLTISYSTTGFSECVLLVKADDNSIILHNGVNAYSNYCVSGGGTFTYPLNNYNNIVSGYQVKLCKGNGLTGPTNTGLYYPNLCSSPLSVTSQ